jgi:alkyl hydroperoxide reductase subunit F
MLDQDLKSQLTQVFSAIETPIELVYGQSSHEKQAELVSMLEDVASTSPKITAVNSNVPASVPGFRIERNGTITGISFRGIPGGHEFTSLIVALLNVDGKGKMPDAGIASRIKALKGPIRLKTYISLTCENCPDVVQALNQMSLIHGDFHHEMVDGGFTPDEVSAAGIQGVPSVTVDSKMIHSGRIAFLDLLVKLEAFYGKDEAAVNHEPRDLGNFDVVVVGGGPAGASAAIYSARKGLRVALLAERMGGQVQDTKGIENLIGVQYTEGPQLADQLYKHISTYPITVFDQRRVKSLNKDKKIELEGGETISGTSVILTTGAKWRELNIPGEKEYIGRGVAYCPHCDGPFYKGKTIAVVGGGNSGVEAAIDLAGTAAHITVLEYNDSLKADKVLVDKLLSLPNVAVLTNARSQEVVADGKKVTALKYFDRKEEKEKSLPLDGIFVQIGLLPNSGFAKDTLELTKFGEIVVDGKGHTSVPGIYAAGDVTTTPFKQIIIAMGEGAKVALAAFEDRMYAGAAH